MGNQTKDVGYKTKDQADEQVPPFGWGMMDQLIELQEGIALFVLLTMGKTQERENYFKLFRKN